MACKSIRPTSRTRPGRARPVEWAALDHLLYWLARFDQLTPARNRRSLGAAVLSIARHVIPLPRPSSVCRAPEQVKRVSANDAAPRITTRQLPRPHPVSVASASSALPRETPLCPRRTAPTAHVPMMRHRKKNTLPNEADCRPRFTKTTCTARTPCSYLRTRAAACKWAARPMAAGSRHRVFSNAASRRRCGGSSRSCRW